MAADLTITLPEEILDGIPLSAGISIGEGFMLESIAVEAPFYSITSDAVPAELERFDKACQKSNKQITKLQTKAETLPAEAAEDIIMLLDVHLALVGESRLTRGVHERIRTQLINAEQAVIQEIAQLSKPFDAMEDNYLAGRVKDLEDVGRRLVRNLLERKYVALKSVPVGGIVLSEEITPADTAFMNPEKIGGFVTMVGGRQSHTAILARSLMLPAVAALPHMPHHLHEESIVIVDGTEGRIIVNPTRETLALYKQKRDADKMYQQRLQSRANEPAVTQDGERIQVEANFSSPDDLERILNSGAEGIGLIRTEYMFIGRDDLPSIQEQYDTLAQIVLAMNGKPVTIRTLDVGGDKISPAIQGRILHEQNPALGLRGVRLTLAMPDLMVAQCTAILRVAALGNVKILLPMVTKVDEVRQFRQILAETATRLQAEKVTIGPVDGIGIMVETPAVAILPDLFAQEADFLSIGTNDLVQYTLAVDRGNELVSPLYDSGHPAIRKLIEQTVSAGRKRGIPVSVCGEMAGDPNYTDFLLRAGVKSLSMASAHVPLIKERIRNISL
jgi:phosphoenolpyruvate-protein phosphotransferase (PTS system enzyme I)